VAVNPVTNQTFVANGTGDNVFAIQDAPVYNTKVRLDFSRLPDDTTVLARPALSGKAVNRWFPGRTRMMGVLNRVGSVRMPWQWADVTGGGGTDSLTWSYHWGADSLVWGENFVCFAPLEDQAAITGILGLGTPFAGNPEVYAVYRVNAYPGIEEEAGRPVVRAKMPTIIRGVLMMEDRGRKTEDRAELVDISGRKALDLHTGANDVRALAPGVYFVRAVSGKLSAVGCHRVIITR
jgi:hypothetical protein